MNVENNLLSFLKTGTIWYPLKTEGNTKADNLEISPQGISPQGNIEQGLGVFQNLLLKNLQSGMESKSGLGNQTNFEELASEIPDEIFEEAGMIEFIHATLTQIPIHRMKMETAMTPVAAKVGTDSLVIETEEPPSDPLVIETEEAMTDNLVTTKNMAGLTEPIVEPKEGPRPEIVAKELNLGETAIKVFPEATIDEREDKPGISGIVKSEPGIAPAEITKPDMPETAMKKSERPGEMGINPNMKVAPGNEIPEMHIPEAKVEKPAVYNQIANQIVSTLKKEGPMEFTVKLNPKELGGVDIRIKMVEGKLSIDIMADRQETHNLLSSQVEKLTSRLGMQNYQVETIQINPAINANNPNVSSQGFPMNFTMDFSNKRHQEKMKDKSDMRIDSLSAADLNISEVQDTLKNGLEIMKFDSHRINYSV